MQKQNLVRALLSLGALAGVASGAYADSLPDVRITEFMYKNENSPAEFVQITNLGTTAVDMTGWSEDDSTGQPGVHPLSGFGVLQPGESGILAETDQATFDAAWNLSSTVPFVNEGSKDNLGNGDAINLYNGSGQLVDSIVYGSSPRSDGTAVVPDSPAVIGTNNYADWELVTASTPGAERANGGTGDLAAFTPFTPVPLPSAVWLLVGGLGVLTPALRRRKQATGVQVA